MISRLIILVITGFWLVMSYLLVRSEFGRRDELATSVPVGKVWEKIITAPDDSSLEVFYHGEKIGYCRWAANVGEESATGKISSEDYQPEGMIAKPSNYTLDMDANLTMKGFTNNLRLNLTIKLSTNHVWQQFDLHASLRPNSWQLSSVAADKTLKLTVDDETGHWEETFTFAELQHPDALLREFGGPIAGNLLSSLLPSSQKTNGSPFSLGLDWVAHNDWMKFGHSKVRVYRMQARLLERFQIYVFASRVGEILWVELPGQFVLSNDAFGHF